MARYSCRSRGAVFPKNRQDHSIYAVHFVLCCTHVLWNTLWWNQLTKEKVRSCQSSVLFDYVKSYIFSFVLNLCREVQIFWHGPLKAEPFYEKKNKVCKKQSLFRKLTLHRLPYQFLLENSSIYCTIFSGDRVQTHSRKIIHIEAIPGTNPLHFIMTASIYCLLL
jgi:hypothetical protein